MTRTAVIIVGAALAVFVVVGGYLVFASAGGAQRGEERTFEVSVAGGKMTPATLEAKSGDTLKITVTADREMEVHLHGYDKTFDVKPGQPATQTFKADKTGTFEIEIESSRQQLGELEVTPR